MKKVLMTVMVCLIISSTVFANDVSIDSDGNVETGISASGNLEVTGASAEKAIVGTASGTGGAGVYGVHQTNGEFGLLGGYKGVTPVGVYGFSQSLTGYGIYGENTVGGYAGYFNGPLEVNGVITGYGSGLKNVHWDSLINVPAGFADGLDGDCDGVACELISSFAINCNQLGSNPSGEIYCSTEDDTPDNDAEVPNNITVDNSSSGFIRLEQSIAPANTTEGRLQWDTDDDQLVVGTGAGTNTVSMLGSNQTLTGVKNFAPVSGSLPFTIDPTKTGLVTSLNADLLDGQEASDIIAAAADEVRTPISVCGTYISTSGSYYVKQNLSTTGTCITVNADNVTIDLMGYTLTGGNVTGQNGIYTNRNNVELKNGTIKNFDYGFRGSPSGHSYSVYRIRAINNLGNGIHLGNSSLARDCITSYNGSNGIVGYEGALITDNTANNNGFIGITGRGYTATNNTTYANGRNGIKCDNDCFINGNTAFGNNTSGGAYLNIGVCATCTFGTNHAP